MKWWFLAGIWLDFEKNKRGTIEWNIGMENECVV